MKFDLWNNDGEGPNSTGLFRNGDKPSNPGALDLAPIDLHAGRAYDAVIDYKDGKLTLLVAEAEDASKKFSAAFDVDVRKTVGDRGLRRLHGRHRRGGGAAGHSVVELGIHRAAGLKGAASAWNNEAAPPE